GKLLEDLINGLRTAQQFAQVATNRISITIKQLLQSKARRRNGSVMRHVDKRPHCRDEAEPIPGVLLLHGLLLRSRRTPKSLARDIPFPSTPLAQTQATVVNRRRRSRRLVCCHTWRVHEK